MIVFDGTGTCQRSETLFGGAAHRTVPILGCLVKGRALGYPAFAIASVGVIDAAAIHRLALIHVFRVGHSKTPYTSKRLSQTYLSSHDRKNNHPVYRVNSTRKVVGFGCSAIVRSCNGSPLFEILQLNRANRLTFWTSG